MNNLRNGISDSPEFVNDQEPIVFAQRLFEAAHFKPTELQIFTSASAPIHMLVQQANASNTTGGASNTAKAMLYSQLVRGSDVHKTSMLHMNIPDNFTAKAVTGALKTGGEVEAIPITQALETPQMIIDEAGNMKQAMVQIMNTDQVLVFSVNRLSKDNSTFKTTKVEAQNVIDAKMIGDQFVKLNILNKSGLENKLRYKLRSVVTANLDGADNNKLSMNQIGGQAYVMHYDDDMITKITEYAPLKTFNQSLKEGITNAEILNNDITPTDQGTIPEFIKKYGVLFVYAQDNSAPFDVRVEEALRMKKQAELQEVVKDEDVVVAGPSTTEELNTKLSVLVSDMGSIRLYGKKKISHIFYELSQDLTADQKRDALYKSFVDLAINYTSANSRSDSAMKNLNTDLISVEKMIKKLEASGEDVSSQKTLFTMLKHIITLLTSSIDNSSQNVSLVMSHIKLMKKKVHEDLRAAGVTDADIKAGPYTYANVAMIAMQMADSLEPMTDYTGRILGDVDNLVVDVKNEILALFPRFDLDDNITKLFILDVVLSSMTYNNKLTIESLSTKVTKVVDDIVKMSQKRSLTEDQKNTINTNLVASRFVDDLVYIDQFLGALDLSTLDITTLGFDATSPEFFIAETLISHPEIKNFGSLHYTHRGVPMTESIMNLQKEINEVIKPMLIM